MCHSLINKNDKIALKVYKKEYVMICEDNEKCGLISEVSMLSCCDHENIIKFIDYGNSGKMQLSNGHVLNNLVYIIMEYVPGVTLF